MTATRTLKAVFDGDSEKFSKAARKAEGDLKRFEKRGGQAAGKTKKLSSASAGAAGALGGLATKLGPLGIGLAAVTAAVVGPIAGILAIGDSAAALVDQVDKAKIVFGDAFPEMDRWARKAATGMGLTRVEALGLTASVQDLLVPMGFSRKEAQGLTMDVTSKLAPALAEWSGGNVDTAGATDVLIKAILGERDGLVALGIKISEAQVQAELAKRGQDKLTGSALEQAKAQVTLALITGKSTDALASYEKGNGKASRKIATTKARIRDKWQEIQVKLLPVVEKLYQIFNDKVLPILDRFVDWLGSPEGKAAIEGWIDTVGGIVSVVGDVIDVVSTALGALSNFNREANATLSGNRGVGDAIRFGMAANAGRRAHGGPVESGRAYVVGERGKEMFVPDVGGRIVPNDELGGSVIHIENFNLRAHSDRFSLRQVKSELAFSGAV